jgi:hypothetical protein
VPKELVAPKVTVPVPHLVAGVVVSKSGLFTIKVSEFVVVQTFVPTLTCAL